MIPVIEAKGITIAEAYEDALVQLKMHGINMITQYDKKGDPPSIDATANITIHDPLKDPMIHVAFPGGIEDLREYVYELEGLKDNWVKARSDKKDTRWEYTYHERLADWGGWMDLVTLVNEQKIGKGRVHPFQNSEAIIVNQIKDSIEKLKTKPFSRQNQMITWVPFLDREAYDPPCLQRIWFRMDQEKDGFCLNTNISFRSNDAWNAFFMNCFGLTIFIKNNILDEVQKHYKDKIRMGRVNWQADSFHIYGKDRQAFENVFMKRLMTGTIKDRTINFWDKEIQNYYHEAEKDILKKIREYKP